MLLGSNGFWPRTPRVAAPATTLSVLPMSAPRPTAATAEVPVTSAAGGEAGHARAGADEAGDRDLAVVDTGRSSPAARPRCRPR